MTDADELGARIAAARDFAQDRAREFFQKGQAAQAGGEKAAYGTQAGIYRSLGQVLNILLGEQPDHDDPTPPRT